MTKELRDFLKNNDITLINNNKQKETVLITGGTSGIGLEFVKLCLEENYRVIFTARNDHKAEGILKELKENYPNGNISYLHLDISDFDSINSFVNLIKEQHIDIHHFYHNAGIFRIPYSLNKQGFEINTATNYFGPYLLSLQLFPYLRSLNHEVHINYIYSCTTYLYHLNYLEINPHGQYSKMQTYARSKICLVHMYYYFLNEYKNTNLRFTLSHPGATYTPLIEKGYSTNSNIFKRIASAFMKVVFHTPKEASYTYKLALYPLNTFDYYIAPRGLFELSGKPTFRKIRYRQHRYHLLTIKKTDELLKEYIKK